MRVRWVKRSSIISGYNRGNVVLISLLMMIMTMMMVMMVMTVMLVMVITMMMTPTMCLILSNTANDRGKILHLRAHVCVVLGVCMFMCM